MSVYAYATGMEQLELIRCRAQRIANRLSGCKWLASEGLSPNVKGYP